MKGQAVAAVRFRLRLLKIWKKFDLTSQTLLKPLGLFSAKATYTDRNTMSTKQSVEKQKGQANEV